MFTTDFHISFRLIKQLLLVHVDSVHAVSLRFVSLYLKVCNASTAGTTHWYFLVGPGWYSTLSESVRLEMASELPAQPNITLNRTIAPVVVGLACWVQVEGYPWWPARIVDRESYEANLELDDDDAPLTGETATNVMVEFFDKDKLCGVYTRSTVVEYVSNIHLVQKVMDSRDEFVQSCREAHEFVMSDGLHEQRQRLASLDPLDDLFNKKWENFFGRLNTDVLRRIALWLSYKPSTMNWPVTVHGSDMENCLSLSKEFQPSRIW